MEQIYGGKSDTFIAYCFIVQLRKQWPTNQMWSIHQLVLIGRRSKVAILIKMSEIPR